MHIAMWSGPRNLSTAMMYSVASRSDFDVIDEPFYAPYLKSSGTVHPMRDDILSKTETDPERVVAEFSKPRKNSLYTKQISHHLLPVFPRDWMQSARHVFLLRHPARVIASYAAKRAAPSLHDIGIMEQKAIFDHVKAAGLEPIVIDSFDVRRDPKKELQALCSALHIPWQEAMLTWPAGGNAADGVWATHWYGAVHQSTGFAGPEGHLPKLNDGLKHLEEQAMPLYHAMAQHKLS